MNEFVEVKTSDLIGPPLDWATAVAIGHEPNLIALWPIVFVNGLFFSPSTSWSQGGPLIEDHKACVAIFCDGDWCCAFNPGERLQDWSDSGYGPTPLIAACRAIVRAKLGETVSVPKELMQ